MPLCYRPIYKHALTHFWHVGLASIFLLQAGCGQVILSHPSASELAKRRGFSWTTITTDHFDVFYEAGSKTADRVAGV